MREEEHEGGILKESWSCNKSVDAQLYVWEPPKISTYLPR